ncbi:ABC transporter permease [Bifidobacterium crudilactis]|uniref:ABC transporter permease n=1 Tax=Bifidobacterium crudilactis TaxID=327277 RepID=UPI00054DB03C|nr:ABC transporter permease [Bifidobacterium crudilactis]MCI2148721.1 ABC transporter permease [Bifidobacterium crudilactis]MCI2156971.1 ABC transporter permease [Bifidobacterium crudilactis]
MKQLIRKIADRYHYAWVVLRGLVKTDFKLRYQGSFLGVAWSVLQPLMLFCVMYLVFARFLRMTDGTPTYPVVLLLGISSWQFFSEATSVGLRSIVDRGDLLRKIHFPNYIVVVSATMGSLISYGINTVVVLIFAFLNRVQFTWRVLLLPINVIQLYMLTLGVTFLLSSMYVYFRDVLHIWDVVTQALFYSVPIVYPLVMVLNFNSYGPTVAKLMMLNPVAQVIQDIRHNFIAPDSTPTVWNQVGNPLVRLIPVILTAVIFALGVYVFKKNNKRFAEIM